MIKLALKRVTPKCEKVQSWTNVDSTKRSRKYLREWSFESVSVEGILKKTIYSFFKDAGKKTKFLDRLTILRKKTDGYVVWRYVGQPDVYIMPDGFYVDKSVLEKHKESAEYAVYRAFKILMTCHLVEGVEQEVCDTVDVILDENSKEDSSLLKRLKFLKSR